MKKIIICAVFLLIITALQIVYYFPKLPENVASYFASNPNEPLPKTAFFILYFSIVYIVFIIFVVLPIFLVRLPVSLWSLPNKEYWLAPERLKQTQEFVCSRLSWVGIATVSLLLIIFQLAVIENLKQPISLPPVPIWVILIPYLLLTYGSVASLLLKFIRK